MSLFETDFFDRVLSQHYLSDTDKGKLRAGLEQFHPKSEKRVGQSLPAKYYTDFYLENTPTHFLQGDILTSIRHPIFDSKTKLYLSKETAAIIISNTCDINIDDKNRDIPKQVLFAPLTKFSNFSKKLENHPNRDNILTNIKNQQNSNVFYLPPNKKNGLEYIALLDRVFWYPTDELNLSKEKTISDRVASLDMFGFYLFILKVSYHLCRLPEDDPRNSASPTN
ncbi:MAG: hypothetical protein MUC49_15735 [Raineya sp.]|jgi:hypothetical protein|nr:hypothetical protein [Raineya sp.]